MTIQNCSNCGGTHYGSLKCPYGPKGPCVECGTDTIWACADCAIDLGGGSKVPLCDEPACRDAHERSAHYKAEPQLPGSAPEGGEPNHPEIPDSSPTPSAGEASDATSFSPTEQHDGRAGDHITSQHGGLSHHFADASKMVPIEEEVERIARIIDPHIFDLWRSSYEYALSRGDTEEEARTFTDYFHGPMRESALSKARAILSPQGGGGKEDGARLQGHQCSPARCGHDGETCPARRHQAPGKDGGR